MHELILLYCGLGCVPLQTPYEVADSNAMRKLLVQEQRAIKIQPAEDMSDGIPDDKRYSNTWHNRTP